MIGPRKDSRPSAVPSPPASRPRVESLLPCCSPLTPASSQARGNDPQASRTNRSPLHCENPIPSPEARMDTGWSPNPADLPIGRQPECRFRNRHEARNGPPILDISMRTFDPPASIRRATRPRWLRIAERRHGPRGPLSVWPMAESSRLHQRSSALSDSQQCRAEPVGQTGQELSYGMSSRRGLTELTDFPQWVPLSE